MSTPTIPPPPGAPESTAKKYAFLANGAVALVREFNLENVVPDGFVMYRDTEPPKADDGHDVVVSGYRVDELGYCTQNWVQTPKVDAQAKPSPEPVPQTVPLWAFRAVLQEDGIDLNIVDALIQTLEGSSRIDANALWNFGNYIDRSHPLIASFGAQLGISEDEIDDKFRRMGKKK